MSGHLFIIRGDITKLSCDAWLATGDQHALVPTGLSNVHWATNRKTDVRSTEICFAVRPCRGSDILLDQDDVDFDVALVLRTDPHYLASQYIRETLKPAWDRLKLLAKKATDGQLVLFLGAGVSMGWLAMLVAELADGALPAGKLSFPTEVSRL